MTELFSIMGFISGWRAFLRIYLGKLGIKISPPGDSTKPTDDY